MWFHFRIGIDLKNKRAVVCGSTQGIGKASAMLLAQAGATVILIARNHEKLAVLLTLHAFCHRLHQYLVAHQVCLESAYKLLC